MGLVYLRVGPDYTPPTRINTHTHTPCVFSTGLQRANGSIFRGCLPLNSRALWGFARALCGLRAVRLPVRKKSVPVPEKEKRTDDPELV